MSHDHREAAPFKVEWNLANLTIRGHIQVAMLYNSLIEWTPNARLVRTIHVAEE